MAGLADIGSALDHNSDWIEGLAMIAGDDPQLALARQQDILSNQARMDEENRAIANRKYLQSRLSTMKGELTPDMAMEIMQYDPELGARLFEQARKMQAQKEKQKVFEKLLGAEGNQEAHDPNALAMMGAMTGDNSMIQLATFLQAQKNRQDDRDFEVNEKPLTEADQRAITLADEGLKSTEALEEMLFDFDKDGNPTYKPNAKEIIAQITRIPGIGALTLSPESNTAFSHAENMTRNNLYLKSGASAPEGEVRGNMGIYAPSITDDDKSSYNKLQKSKEYFKSRRGVVRGGEKRFPSNQKSAPGKYRDGQTATGPNGQKLIYRDGKWRGQ